MNNHRRFLFSALAALLAAPCFATPVWKLYASYPTPGPDPRGYWSSNPEAGYIVMDGPNPYVYRYSWEQASIRWSFPAPGGPGAWGVLCFSGEFYITNNRTSWIYETTGQGSVTNSFRCPFDGPADLDFKASFPPGLMVAIPDRNILVQLDRTTGSLIGTYAGPGSRPTGCSGYGHLYVADASTRTVYENGSPIITGIQNLVGLCAGWTGTPPYDVHLYIIDTGTDRYYFYTRASEMSVAPASLGRVKALFK
jgi:hypothetical protein